jgi:hypothetical protein
VSDDPFPPGDDLIVRVLALQVVAHNGAVRGVGIPACDRTWAVEITEGLGNESLPCRLADCERLK